MQPAVVRVAVCVITFRRPEGLTRLIHALNDLSFQGDPPELEIVVVDNDSSGPACELCDTLRAKIRWPLRCVVEPRRGIPQARNTAVSCVLGRVDFVAFIDDDEVPDPGWLDALLRTQQTYRADVVTGPALPHFMEAVPDWLTRGGFFERPRHATGARLDYAITGNVLFRTSVFERIEGGFDERLSLSGGEDRHFFKRVSRAGFTIVWADDAITHEWTPPSRATVAWILRRAFRNGANYDFRYAGTRRSLHVTVDTIARGAARILLGLVLLPTGLVLGRHGLMRRLRDVCYGAGVVAGAVGVRYEEYRTIHGK